MKIFNLPFQILDVCHQISTKRKRWKKLMDPTKSMKFGNSQKSW
jgi:hypothetical protein